MRALPEDSMTNFATGWADDFMGSKRISSGPKYWKVGIMSIHHDVVISHTTGQDYRHNDNSSKNKRRPIKQTG